MLRKKTQLGCVYVTMSLFIGELHIRRTRTHTYTVESSEKIRDWFKGFDGFRGRHGRGGGSTLNKLKRLHTRVYY